MRFLLDEDLPTSVAEIARGLGLDVSSVQELGRLGIADDDQLRFAVAQGYVFVTRNRDDFVESAVAFAARDEPHPGVVIVPRRLPNVRPEAIAHALLRWADAHAGEPAESLRYRADYLS